MPGLLCRGMYPATDIGYSIGPFFNVLSAVHCTIPTTRRLSYMHGVYADR